jgi:hypothetical protein
MIPKVGINFFIIKKFIPTFGIISFEAVPPKSHWGVGRYDFQVCICG